MAAPKQIDLILKSLNIALCTQGAKSGMLRQTTLNGQLSPVFRKTRRLYFQKACLVKGSHIWSANAHVQTIATRAQHSAVHDCKHCANLVG